MAFFLLYVLLQTFYASEHRNPAPNPGPPSPFIPMVVVAEYISGIASFVTGLISLIKRKERAILVFLVVAVGSFALLFLVGELLLER
jgi:hypothetical protein